MGNRMNLYVLIVNIALLLINSGSCVPFEISSSSSSSSSSSPSSESSSDNTNDNQHSNHPIESTTSNIVISPSSTSSTSSSSHSYSHSSPSAISAAHERTLLITQKWLIDNINLLRREMSEMARDYNQHIDANKQEVIHKEDEFIRDVDSLRADHTLLARNQLQIINLIKNGQYQQHSQSQQQSSNNENTHQPLTQLDQQDQSFHRPSTSRKHLRHLVYDLIKEEANFEKETKHNLSSLTTQLTDLHQMTLSLYRDLKLLKKKVQSVDFDQLTT